MHLENITKKNKDEFIEYCKRQLDYLDTEDAYDYWENGVVLMHEDMLFFAQSNNFEQFSNIRAFVNDTKVVGFAEIIKMDDVDIHYLYMLPDYEKDILNFLKNEPQCYVCCNGIDDEINGLYECDFKSNIKSDEIDDYYIYSSRKIMLSELYVNNEKYKDVIKNIIEDKLFKDTGDKIEISKMNDHTLLSYIDNQNNSFIDALNWRTKYGITTLAGFHYFEECSVDKFEHIVARQGDKIVGVIKYKLYNNPGQIPHIGINFIDVQKGFRHKGIAKEMIKALNNELDNSYPVFLSSTSKLGKEYKMEEYFKKFITNTDVVSYDEQYDYSKNIEER